VQGNQGSIEQGQDNSFVPAFYALRDESTTTANAGAGTVWAGSAFDLAQGLEVTVFETRMSLEDLDELFR
jgi:hypothetical protein